MNERLPVPGEEGWQGLYGESDWHDVDVIAGPFYSATQLYDETNWVLRDPSLRGSFSEALYLIEGPQGKGGAFRSDMRRKPIQRDNKAAHNTFKEIIDSYTKKGSEVPA